MEDYDEGFNWFIFTTTNESYRFNSLNLFDLI